MRRRYLEIGLFIVILLSVSLIYFFVDKIAGIILLGIVILIFVFLQFLANSNLGLFLRFPHTYRLLKRYAIVRESQLSTVLKITPGEVHRILFHFSKNWVASPLVVLVKNQYLCLNRKAIEKIQSLSKEFQENGQTSRQSLIRVLQKQIKFQSREEIEAVLEKI